MRSLPSRLRQCADRVLHPLRRRRALARLRRRGAPASIAFVCHGNICRSPYAAAAFSRRLPQTFSSVVRVESAGFIGPGRPPPPNAVKVAERRGLDLSTHRSTLVGPLAGSSSNLVVVMEPGQGRAIRHFFARAGRDITVLGDLDPEPIATRAIEDPVEQSEAAFERCYARIDRCVEQLARSFFGEAGRR